MASSNVKSSHELTLKGYQQQLRENTKRIYDNFTEILRTKTEHVNLEVQVRSNEIVRSYQLLMQLVAEIRSFLIINDLIDLNPHQPTDNQQMSGTSTQQPSVSQQYPSSQQSSSANQSISLDEKLLRLRDEMSMFLYELEIPLP